VIVNTLVFCLESAESFLETSQCA